MAENTVVKSGGMGLLGWTFIAFLVLKLGVGDTGVQDWSWWLVTAPLWGPFAVFLVLAGVALIIAGILWIFQVIFVSKKERERRKNLRNVHKALDDLSSSLNRNRR